MSASSEGRKEPSPKTRQKISPEEKPASSEIKTESNRKDRRKEWWKKKQQQNFESSKVKAPPHQNDNENSREKSSGQISKLRDRQTIAKPNSLQYEPNFNRGFQAKILHSLYNSATKKKNEKETAKDKDPKSQKRKLNVAKEDQNIAKKVKADPPAPVQQPEYFDSYTFSMNLINGEVEKVKAQQNQKGKDSKNKYVLFIGNLPHDVTREQLEEHFRKTGGIKAIRIPREKGNDKGRGFAYMEFDGRISHGIALRLHQTTLGGRKINVEFTSIGGGKSLARREKLRQKNIKRRKMKMR